MDASAGRTPRRVLIAPSEAAFVTAAQALIAAQARAAIAARGRFLLALAGGSTPRHVYAALAASDLDWPHWEICWSDERTVPPDHPESNYGMAAATLLAPLAARGMQPGRVYRMEGERDPADAALRYEAALRALADGGIPSLDLILLGMGADGHTASLFPNTAALAEQTRLVVANAVPALNTTRLTFTYPLLNAARAVLFLVRGADKADAVAAVLNHPAHQHPLPSLGVNPKDGALVFLLDKAAAQAVQ